MFLWYLQFSWRHAVGVLHSWNSNTLTSWKESYDKPRQYIKKQRHYFPNKSLSSQSYSFSSSHVWMWALDHKEGWVPKNWCFWTMVLVFLRVSWTARSNQSILKETNPEYALGVLLKLKRQYFGQLMQRVDSLEKTHMMEELKAKGERENRE